MISLNRFYRQILTRMLALALGGLFAALPVQAADSAPLSMLHTQDGEWRQADGTPIALKGANLGNWLILEFWMMGQRNAVMDDQCTLQDTLDKRFGYAERERLMKVFKDNWMTARDWDLLPSFGLNLVRLPFIWSLIEDEKHPGHLRVDAWNYLDAAIDQAEARGLYVILDLHGAVGSQGTEHHSGCAGKNLFWSTPAYQERTTWLWQQIAARYKDRAAVAGYSLLNEPWGTESAEMVRVMKALYANVRAVDPHHVIIFPGHNSGIDGYGNLNAQGLRNAAFEMHFYPGHFGWGKPGSEVHRKWLLCQPAGSGVCEWQARMKSLNAALFVGEFQPWADMELELGGQITRTSYDAYAKNGWASAAWAYKLLSNEGGQGADNWGLVTNRKGMKIPALDFATASSAEIETLFLQFGAVPYEPHTAVQTWMQSKQAPKAWATTTRPTK